MNAIASRIKLGTWNTYTAWKEILLLNSCISGIKHQIERKTGVPALPASPGFRDYALNRLTIEQHAKTVLENIRKSITVDERPVGALDKSKGALTFRAEHRFQDGTVSDSSFHPSPGVKKVTQKQFATAIRDINKHVYDSSLFEHIAKLNDEEDFEKIKTVNELLLARKEYYLDGAPYSPSTGEKSMLMLHLELAKDKEIYLLDEPEHSLGNDYINDVIVPLIKEKARLNKKVFISTHDANIAVRTLPYSSVYRRHGSEGYETFIGNPFSNDLVNIDMADDRLDWKKISMRTLEGGEEAFGERGKIYGHQ